ncbi:tRNA (adenosine(37)-N6)-threonylcarbamoyltransferase complex ATPase subunit type 1 TsaE [Frankia sp. Cr1]|uniref:tRNA (adenosine(37)-N6)-threonylcarbamoyltransferase complex ATPase subunit type 1 TsaE n=1 Tax=Frankia sp. Cr1 TaxID=3073931 RepID=UPI002AD42654|nr:tRNA (adenosine(37)-N6)-threonylcarbamoyltransferase complex ATPase subunit type 1 TsaE [Frankia sp. Cr1]
MVEVPTAGTMRAVGRRLAGVLRAGDLVILAGPLGAGKTVLVQGIAAGLGVIGAVTSPTFVIARVHDDGRVPLVHVDAYRLGAVAEVEDIDLDAEIEESVTVVEWGSGLVEGLASGYLRVEIERPPEAAPLPGFGDVDDCDDSGVRVIRMVGSDRGWSTRLRSLWAEDKGAVRPPPGFHRPEPPDHAI